MSNRQWYEEYQAELRAEQEGRSREEVLGAMKQKTEYVFDPATAPKQAHRWVERGLVLSCEGAGHPYHQVHKRLPME